MKRASIFALFLVLLLASSSAKAARVSGGLKGGLNVATLSGADATDAEAITGAVIGWYVRVVLNERFSVQPELLFTRNGAKADTLDIEGTIKLNYAELPVLIRYSFPTGEKIMPSLFVGPAVSGLLSAKAEAEVGGKTRSIGIESEISDFDLSVIIGGDVGFSVGRPQITIEARYKIGLSSIDDTGQNADVTNRVFSALIGIFFGFDSGSAR